LGALKEQLSKFKFLKPVGGFPVQKIEYTENGTPITFDVLRDQLFRLMKSRNPELKFETFGDA
jgi:hypothetical protein